MAHPAKSPRAAQLKIRPASRLAQARWLGIQPPHSQLMFIFTFG
jgi:hypothetical protein